MRDDRYIWDDVSYRKRNHLPHLDVPGGLYFVTWCLADAIRPAFMKQLEMERRRRLGRSRERFGNVRPVDVRQVEKWMRKERFDELDRGRGRCDLARPEIAELVTSSLFHFDQERYRLLSHVLMPNHVHVIVRSDPNWPWWKITGSWKSFTARQANRILGRSGSFWQDDSYDTLIRSKKHLE
ncbi:MAG: transposase, partial [Acidobacteria bacterium]|nr:transposase [Acidobacteriota bacterium]